MVLSDTRPLIYDLDYSDLVKAVDIYQEPAYRSEQIWQGLYQQLWNSADSFTTLPKEFRERLGRDYSFQYLTPVNIIKSFDNNTIKVLFSLIDDNSIETVLMRYKSRNTLCISSQSGCALGCVFCATGQMGFERNLRSGEIIEQVLYFYRELSRKKTKLTNIVFMGMGEPFQNYSNTMRAIKVLNHSMGLNISPRRFTISTVGLIPGIRRFMHEDSQINLAVSLHSVDNDIRSSLMPINRVYSVDELIHACVEYVQKTKRRISFEWALIKNINDSTQHAQELVEVLKMFILNDSILCHVNLIPLNPNKSYNGESSTQAGVNDFKEVLNRNHIPCTIRVRRGIEIHAGCGQLAAS